MRSLPLALSLLATLSLSLIGCTEEEPAMFVIGAVDVSTATHQTGFRFDQNTSLVDEELAVDEPFAGRCLIGPGEGAFDVVISRPAVGADDEGALRSLRVVRTGDEVSATIELGQTRYSATADEAECQLGASRVDTNERRVNLTLDCALSSPEGDEADTSGWLNVGACDVL